MRAVLNQQNQPVELTSYYPYGGIIAATAAEGVQPHKYGGKELDRENGLNWYDSRARYYDPLLGRTPTQDPKAEQYYHLSPYLWCAANPISFTDPSGNYIVGIDNCPISYDKKTKTWSSNVSEDIVEIGEAMMMTTTGTAQLEKMINESDYPIYLKIELHTSQENSNQLGSTKNFYTSTFEGKRHTGAMIKIFKSEIEKKGNYDDKFLNFRFPLEALVGFVAVHESEHALNPNAAQDNVGKEKAEMVANQIENIAIEEYINNKKINER